MPTPDSADGEFDLIRRFFQGLDGGPDVTLGNGDDAAALRLGDDEELVVSADSMVEGVHFPPAADAEQVAYRAIAGAASDLAAMGARPLGMTLALTLPEADADWLAACRRGLAAAVADFSLPLVGGDLTRGALNLAVQVLGAVPRGAALRRSGARPGDTVWVSACLGDAAAGLEVVLGNLNPAAEIAESLVQRFWRPAPALALGRELLGTATACIDISDGLLADAGHIAAASGVAIEIDAPSLPLSTALCAAVDEAQARRWALGGGEDYVLCFTLPSGVPAPAGCYPVGRVVAGAGVHCDDAVEVEGYRHF